MKKEIVISGFGGQGGLAIGKNLAEAGMAEGLNVTWAPSYGPEMRGGTANCSVVLSDKPVGSPVFAHPTELIALNEPSLVKFEEGVVPGGGTALLRTIDDVTALSKKVTGDVRTGVNIVLRALEEPVRQIAANAGLEGSVIVEKIKARKDVNYGFDALNNEYGDMAAKGIIDPTKVTRSALQNAASIASVLLTTESLVCDLPEKNPAPAAPAQPPMY